MRRVTREDRWDKLTNNQETRWVGSRKCTWAHMAHRKLRQKPCAHKKNKKTSIGQQTNHQPYAKQDMNMQLMRILISRVFTQDMTTWMHAADRTQTACDNKKHNTGGQKSTQLSELETAHSHNETEHGARGVSEPQHKTETQDMSAGIRTPHSNMKQGTHTRSRALT